MQIMHWHIQNWLTKRTKMSQARMRKKERKKKRHVGKYYKTLFKIIHN